MKLPAGIGRQFIHHTVVTDPSIETEMGKIKLPPRIKPAPHELKQRALDLRSPQKGYALTRPALETFVREADEGGYSAKKIERALDEVSPFLTEGALRDYRALAAGLSDFQAIEGAGAPLGMPLVDFMKTQRKEQAPVRLEWPARGEYPVRTNRPR